MKLLLRVVIGVVLLVVGVLLAAFLMLPRLLDGETVRERLQQASRDSLGRELRYESLEFGFLPPSLRVMQTSVSGASEGEPPLLEAREIALQVALLPLFAGTVLVDSLVADGATLHLTRTADGIELPTPPDAGEPEPEPEAESGGSAVNLAVRELALRDTTLRLVDRAVSPAVTWELQEVAATGSGSSLDGPIELQLDAVLASGGRFEISGTATLAGELDLDARLDAIVIDPVSAYLGDDLELAGRLGGTGSLHGPAASLREIELDLTGDDVRFRQNDLAVRGAVDVRAKLVDPTGAAQGSFELDATRAELDAGGGFTKPSGTPATVTGRIEAAEGGGLAIDDVRLLIKNFEATGRLSSLDPLRAELQAKPFALDGWEALLPGLADSPPTGRLSLEGIVFKAEPPDLRGRVSLDDVALRSANAPPVLLRGALNAEGQRIRSDGLVAQTGGQTVDLGVTLSRLFDTPRYDVTVKTKDADSNALLTAFAERPDTLFGPLGLDASFRGDLGGDVVQALVGRVDFGVIDGRLAGVSLLRAVVDRLGAVGSLAVDFGRAYGGRDLQRFYGDQFERLSGVLDVRDGVARTDDLTFVYQGYGVKLRGTLGLADLAVDMRGELTISEELDAQLAEAVGVGGSYRPRKRDIQLAAVKGTLSEPKVSIPPNAAVQLAASYATGSLVNDAVGDAIGGDAGEVVDDLLQGILGGGRR